MHIRPAKPGDADELQDIAWAAKAHWGYAAEQMAAWWADLAVNPEHISRWPHHVAEVDGRIAGFCWVSDRDGRWSLEGLWVRPEYMRRGVGRRLLLAAAASARAAGSAMLAIDADPNAEAFYVACGARRVGRVPAPIAGDPGRVRPQLQLPTDPP